MYNSLFVFPSNILLFKDVLMYNFKPEFKEDFQNHNF